MAASQSVFFCQQCGAQSIKWMGRCPACGAWNSLVEEKIQKTRTIRKRSALKDVSEEPVPIDSISLQDAPRLVTNDAELNRVLGGGIVPGTVVLLGGEPGFGKSTLLLQLALQLSQTKVLYVSGEESIQQIRLRADRLGSHTTSCYLLAETRVDILMAHLEQLRPELVIVDSIQTLQSPDWESPAGSVSQVRACTAELLHYAKQTHVPVFLIGHITKEGQLAGPKVLEHMVDVVLQLEGDRHHGFRVLRALKNRFGSAFELGLYQLTADGMMPVTNPSEWLITVRDQPASGIAIACMLEGMRPLLIETQALVTPSLYGTPQRSSTGYDVRRLNMLLAVLEKRCGFRFGTKDVFFNIAGGLRVDDPAIDLGVVAALISSFEDMAIAPNVCFCGEIGLAGEIRAVSRLDQRMREAAKMGYQTLFISKHHRLPREVFPSQMHVHQLSTVSELIGKLF